MSSSSRWPEPSVLLNKREARRFLLAHQMLWPPRNLSGKPGILRFVRRVGAIQFDPVNVVGRSPDLALQARVRGYRPELLEQLLYRDRRLIDGWDKVASILLTEDWPYFARHRARMRAEYGRDSHPRMKAAPQVMAALRAGGPLSSIDFKERERVPSDWGFSTTLVRAALEILYAMGEVVVDHRVGTRRAFDLAERLLPAELLAATDPIEQDAEYWGWRVVRRVGGLGLASPTASEFWLAMQGMKSPERKAILVRQVEAGELLAVAVEEVPGRTFFLRRADLPTLEAVRGSRAPRPQASFIGPLDNLMWHREVVRRIFDFDYTWEVYKPAQQRKYGYYVLPVLYGDRFVARFDPKYDRSTGELTIAGWWWEPGVRVGEALQAAVARGLGEFAGYLGAGRIRLARKLIADRPLARAVDLAGGRRGERVASPSRRRSGRARATRDDRA